MKLLLTLRKWWCLLWHAQHRDQFKAEFVRSWMIFEFVEVKPCGDPPDMFFAVVKPIRQTLKQNGRLQRSAEDGLQKHDDFMTPETETDRQEADSLQAVVRPRVTHAYFGKHVGGKFVRTGATALCGATDGMPSTLSETPPEDLCVICRALYEHRDLAGI